MEPFHGVVFFVGALAGYADPVGPVPDHRNYTGFSAVCNIRGSGPNPVGFYLYGPLYVFDTPGPGSPADKAGLKKGDVILTVGGVRHVNPNHYQLALSRLRPGTALTYVVERGGEQLTLKLTTEDRDPEWIEKRAVERFRRP